MSNALFPYDEHVLSLAIEQSREGIAIHDDDGLFNYINPAMATMYGYRWDELKDQTWHLFYDDEQIDFIENKCFPLLLNNGFWRGELIGRKKSGDAFEVDISLTLLKGDKGKPNGLVCRSQDISESKKSQLELSSQKQQYQLLFDHSPVLIAYIGHDYRYNIANKRYCEWVGKPFSEIIGQHIKHILSEESFNLSRPNIDLALLGEPVNFEAKVPHSSGELKWVNANYVPDKNSDGKTVGIYAFISDIDEQKRKTFAHETIMHAVDSSIEGFGLLDEHGIFTYMNSAHTDVYGYDDKELIGQSWKTLYAPNEAERIEKHHFPQLRSTGRWQGETQGQKKSGESIDVEISLTSIKDETGNDVGLFCSCRDISEQKKIQRELDFLAYHDHLTGLPNRLMFKERLDLAITRAKRRNNLLAVLFIDLDHFKYVNDTLGHSVGDQLLILVAQRIKSVLREEDTVARLSGDEFTVIITDLTETESIDLIVNKLMQVFQQPLFVDKHEFDQGISVGISVFPRDGDDAEYLMKNADAAMYRAKDKGRQGYQYYLPSLTDSAFESMVYPTQLKNALENDEFILHYQPIICLQQNRVMGFEALIRWQHPKLGLVFPDKFIRYAEESNLIVPMGYWVIEKVCDQIAKWNKIGMNFDKVAVNISGIQLQSTFADDVVKIIEKTNTNPEQLEFEITETFLMKGLNQPVAQLDSIRALGASLAIDDFGVGYSSLSQLKQLKTHCLKIDKSFVDNIVDDSDDRAIVEAIIALGKTLNMVITAEGVETEEQYHLLRDLGCLKAQGYYFAKPQAANDIPALYQSLNTLLNQADGFSL